MGTSGFSKLFAALSFAVLIGSFFGYRTVHASVDHHTAIVKQQVAAKQKTDEATQLQTKLVGAWKQTLATNPPDGNVDIAVHDTNTGATFNYTDAPANSQFITASAIKLSVLETTLLQNQEENISGLTPSQLSVAIPMIENSDNDAATTLWNEIGGSQAINTFFAQIGAANSEAGGGTAHWGWSTTTALDQVKVATELAHPTILNAASAAAADTLLDHIESDQRWGISAGVPSGVLVRLKNGWLDPDETEDGLGWVVNSVGYVQGNHADYEIAVLTDNDTTEQDGIATIEALATDAWAAISTMPKAPDTTRLDS